ncbi:hypothetical protein [Mycobacterium vicinigordonae]|uniref:Uncharacterized protein n=1 Tax=Mycobacterium vicinigordonae TaxID=1719132 RepID=A0A7D6E4X5_9MYCO|nr:hypothetical protein [Mycobacterium vicinigordonae]QLL07442.1 hypothetical protein H0P51_28060 [Mycobacterium vicinigordonae]
MDALIIGKVLLLGFIIVGCGIVISAYVRRRRAGVRPWRNPYAAPYLDIYDGGRPPMPPPPPAITEPGCDDEAPPHDPGRRG